MMKKLLFAVLLCIVGLAHAHAATEIAGARFEDKVNLGETELQLNGAGQRVRFFIKFYAIGLYLPEKKTLAADAIALNGAKRLKIVILRDLPATQFADALLENIRKNNSAAELEPLKSRLDDFIAAVLSAKTAHQGDTINVDWLPANGARLTMNGKQLGKDIAGEDFYRAVMKIWLGAKPVQEDLREALLGKRQ